jgi:hypothetical protein
MVKTAGVSGILLGLFMRFAAGVGTYTIVVFCAAAWAFLALFSLGVQAAEVGYTRLDERSGYISVKGDIEDLDLQEFERVLAENPNAQLVLLESPGGRLEPALEIGKLIRTSGMWTAAFGECASACAYIWMAGRSMVVSENTQVGFHSPYEGEDGESVSSVGNALVGAYLNELGFSSNVIAYATSARPNDMQWLSPRDAQLLGLQIAYFDALPDLLASLKSTPIQQNAEEADSLMPPAASAPAPSAPATSAPSSPDIKTGSVQQPVAPETETATAIPPSEAPRTTIDPPKQTETEKWSMAIYEGVDFWGGDKYPKGIEAASAEACMAKCAADKECKLFTYNQAYKSCYIKTKMDLVVLSENLTSGMVFKPGQGISDNPRIRSDFRLFQGKIWRLPYLPFGQPKSKTINGCLRHCAASEGCENVTFNSGQNGGKACIMWRFLAGGLTDKTNATSFRKEKKSIKPSSVTDLTPLRPIDQMVSSPVQ